MKNKRILEIKCPGAAARNKPERFVEYTFDEFTLLLPQDWRELAEPPRDTLEWDSSVEDAWLAVRVKAHQAADGEVARLSESNLAASLRSLQELAPGEVTVLRHASKPRPDGEGMEFSYVAETARRTHFQLGYVTRSKVLSFGLICGACREEAMDLYDRFLNERLRLTLH